MKEEKDDINSNGDCSDDDMTGFLFEGAEPTKEEILSFSPSSLDATTSTSQLSSSPEPSANLNTTINAIIERVDDNPGALQSGHYLWPAAPALAQYLVDLVYKHRKDGTTIFYKNAIELGAGCSLAGIVASQILNLDVLICTDHDPGTLARAKKNYEATFQSHLTPQILLSSGNDDSLHVSKIRSNADYTSSSTPIRIHFQSLRWGADIETIDELLQNTLTNTSHSQSTQINNKIDLILGSDLIYCQEVVRPLLKTASNLLNPHNKNAIFIMTQSFVYEKETELEIDKICHDLGFTRNIIRDDFNNDEIINMESQSRIKIQLFAFCTHQDQKSLLTE